MSQITERLLSDFEKVRRTMVKFEGTKGVPYEMEYARIYDRLALAGEGNRRRLRKKYRG